jgi:hypothetical protein
MELRQLPWHTTWLHYPRGTSLIAHTLAPFNATIAVPMLQLGFSLAQAYNAVFVFSFVMAGVTTFWLARRVTGSYVGSLFAGAAFTFCHFHFAHAQNHLQVVSIEWLPLAILAVYELVTRPTVWKGAVAAGAVLLVALVDFHQVFWVGLAGTVFVAVSLSRLLPARKHGASDPRAPLRVAAKRWVAPGCVFVALTSATTGVLAFQLLRLNRADPLQQNHDSKAWCVDVVDPLIPGAQWRFAELTRPVWQRLDEERKAFVYVEHSLYVGWVMLGLCVYAFRRRRAIALRDAAAWFALGIVFFLFALGPRLHVAGHITPIPGVYSLLELLVPPLKIGGVPMRMMAVVYLAGAILSAAAIGEMLRANPRRRAVTIVALLVAAWALETWPKPQPTTAATYPDWVLKLRDMPAGAVLDTTFLPDMFAHLYYATGHGHPVGEGYISRYPKSVEIRRGHLRRLIEQRRFDAIRAEFGFRYIVVNTVEGRPTLAGPSGAAAVLPYRTVYDRDGVTIYDAQK